MVLLDGPLRRLCSWALLATLLAGCGTMASLYLKNGNVVSGRIERSDEKLIFVRPETVEGGMSYAGGTLVRVPRSSVVDISHPGNGAMVMGVIATVTGVVLLKANASCGLTTMEFPCQLTHIPLYVGVPLFFWGFGAHVSSSGAANPRSAEWQARHTGADTNENRWRGQ
jgi:hypothetical protein